MGVHVHRSERSDTLLSGLAALLSDGSSDPFAPELIAVPTAGIERFITQSLGRVLGTSPDRSDGVCANVEFPSPAALTDHVVAGATGIPSDGDPWQPRRLVWHVLAAIDTCLGQLWAAPLASYLRGDRIDRRFALAQHVSDLLTSYGRQRPAMVLDWLAGIDDVPADLAWQPQLLRHIRAAIGLPGPAERLASADAALRADACATDLPGRISVFGATRLPASHRQILEALGVHREVHLWLADPSPAQWVSVGPAVSHLRQDDSSASQIDNPLLRSLGRDSRELAMLLRGLGPASDQYLPTALTHDTLLGSLQRQVRDDTATSAIEVPHDDRSLQVHACHGQARQAEVVREVILGLLQDNPDLEPRDILIMCPDLTAFAPLLSAAFADTVTLRLRIADRTPEQSNEVLSCLAALLSLLTSRMELSALLDFAALPAVRHAFGFGDDDLERLEALTAGAGIRWGLDVAARGEFSLPLAQSTWRWGIDRLLLGVAMSQDGLAQLDGVLPVDDVNSGDVALVGRLAELVTRLELLRPVAHTRHPAQHWFTIMRQAVEDLMSVRPSDAWQMSNALGVIGSVFNDAGAAAVDLSLADVRWLLASVLAGRPTRSNFRTGDLTVCGLAPMRSVPHKVICLVGMDDGAFPRTLAADGDDVLVRAALVGERDARSEDRQVLLDAIMAATDALVITYTGADERTNATRPPCVPLGDLLDTIDAMTAGRGRDHVRVFHPLQPFDPRNFTDAALGTTGPFSHDRTALAAARRATHPRQPRPSWHIRDLPDLPVREVTLRDLSAFLASPPAAFLRARLGVSVRRDLEPAPERLPIELSGLDKWQIGDRALHLLASGEPASRVAAAERARGALPPGGLGAEVMTEVGRQASGVAGRYEALRTGDPRQVPVALDLPNGIRVVGGVGDVHPAGIVRATYSKAKPRDQLKLWPELLALAATNPNTSWRAHLVAKDSEPVLAAPGAQDALDVLAQLVDMYLAGLRCPLPVVPATSLSYARRRSQGASSSAAVRAADSASWRPTYGPERELPEVVALWGPDQGLAVLLAEPPQSDENWFDEDTRFGMLARRLWQPLLDAGGGR